ncbi:MAG: PspC domain-containing protein [Burkholderiales bacterium]|nr:PspC domain-containing protein [Burkholderiales bacterium]
MSLSDELTRLHDLHRSGALSDDEYAAAKARVIAAGGGAPREGAGSGAGAEAASAMQAVNALRRPRADRWVGGVCAGLAVATGLEAWVWRLLFVLLALWGGAGLMVYVLLWIFVPSE